VLDVYTTGVTDELQNLARRQTVDHDGVVGRRNQVWVSSQDLEQTKERTIVFRGI
jgi:hypothetical protein